MSNNSRGDDDRVSRGIASTGGGSSTLTDEHTFYAPGMPWDDAASIQESGSVESLTSLTGISRAIRSDSMRTRSTNHESGGLKDAMDVSPWFENGGDIPVITQSWREERKRSCDAISRSEEQIKQNDEHLRYVAKELCPLVDRLGRMLTDLSPFLRNFAEDPIPSDSETTTDTSAGIAAVGSSGTSISNLPAADSIRSGNAFEANLLSLLRYR